MEQRVIYQEVWPSGRLIHLKLTSHALATSIYKSFLPFTTIPTAAIRHVEIGRLGLSKLMTISYYKTPDTFVTTSFPIRDRDAWRRAFRTLGIAVD